MLLPLHILNPVTFSHTRVAAPSEIAWSALFQQDYHTLSHISSFLRVTKATVFFCPAKPYRLFSWINVGGDLREESCLFLDLCFSNSRRDHLVCSLDFLSGTSFILIEDMDSQASVQWSTSDLHTLVLYFLSFKELQALTFYPVTWQWGNLDMVFNWKLPVDEASLWYLPIFSRTKQEGQSCFSQYFPGS